MAKHAFTTRRALFGAALVLPAVVMAAPALAEALRNQDTWASLSRTAAALAPDGTETISTARRLGFDPDDCASIFWVREGGERRLIVAFKPGDSPGEFEPVYVDRTGVIEWRAV